MSSYSIRFTKSAKKEFHKLPKKIQARVVEALNVLATNPYSELLKVKKLRGEEELFRTRIGDYRLLYQVQGGKLIVLVIKIGHRREVYKKR